jgi:formate hydrogenlyase transcriptional activator
MEAQAQSTAEEIQRLQRCINDLVSVLALPAMWSGHDSSQIAITLLDALVRMLHLDFAYVRMSDSVEDSGKEWARSAGRHNIEPDAIGRALEHSLTNDALSESLVLPNPIGQGVVSLALFRLGLRDELGRFAAASHRADFPTAIEQLLLQVAANQAAIGLQEARYLRQQRRATEELEQRVVERTSELASVNEELRKEILERTRAEDRIRQSERDFRQILDFAPQHVAVLGPDLDRTRLYANHAALDYFGLTLEEWRIGDRRRFFHPDDREHSMSEAQSKFLSGSPHEIEVRLRRKDGQYRWFLFRVNPILDGQGRITQWYSAGTDIEDRKQAEQRLHNENVALREEIDRASMFEEIVGTSPRLQMVLSRISKVAGTDSSVLITGETGTGKELVARAIHKRSRRSSRAFVSVNCAAIPRDLIASELFGHEKGAFTGATHRRLGRFELAEGGTIFLDEIGELPAETQIALLRVLQEREFERVGGTGSIRTNVRVIAATNRDLEAAIAAGTFRSDLYYRLNVFPIEIPPLRERREDIPLLVEYFIDRYARKAGKSFQAVNKRSLDQLQSYPWPGNIRELQNVIERSVVVCETESFSVDESWLSRQPVAIEPNKEIGLFKKLPSQEKIIIEAALSESGGRVYGPSGAAAKLGIPRSTLEHKIRSLKINKNRFKTSDPSKNS